MLNHHGQNRTAAPQPLLLTIVYSVSSMFLYDLQMFADAYPAFVVVLWYGAVAISW